jgi:uncharacterized protein
VSALADLPRALVDLARERCQGHGPAHDFAHVMRVTANARRIAAEERLEAADARAAVLAALLHELVSFPKDDPRSRESGDACAVFAERALREAGEDEATIGEACAAIRDHGFSKGVVPTRPAARVLQDADRLDAIGAVGVARLFATSGEMRRPLWHPDDPFAETGRELDDKEWGVDHFARKLFTLEARLHTAAARRLAEPRVRAMRAYVDALRVELRAACEGV